MGSKGVDHYLTPLDRIHHYLNDHDRPRDAWDFKQEVDRVMAWMKGNGAKVTRNNG